MDLDEDSRQQLTAPGTPPLQASPQAVKDSSRSGIMSSAREFETPAAASDVGCHCSLSTCNTLDFLPIKCGYCSSLYCRHHASPSSHSCLAVGEKSQSSFNNSLATTTSVPVTTTAKTTTSRTGPELRELLPDPKRNKLNSGIHAVQTSQPTQKPLTAQELALARLKASFDARKMTSNVPKTEGMSSGNKQKKVNPMIQLMKLKQRAKGADPRKRDGDVPVADRWYLTAVLIEGSSREEVATEETISGGKVLDLLADLFQVSNVNHLARVDPSKRLSLALCAKPSEALDLSARIDTLVPNGSAIALCRGIEPSP